jgi:uncharacterized cupin superfamily protein
MKQFGRSSDADGNRAMQGGKQRMVEEASLEELSSGLAPATEGWFVVNVRDAAWVTGPFGAACFFESETVPFADLGINLRVLSPGRSKYLYHGESAQEGFLVLAGECLLLIDGEERPLRAWDFVHCPPGAEHAFVAMGDGPCIIVMAGTRTTDLSFVYPRSDLALRHGVGVETETNSPTEALARFAEWQLGRPDDWHALPWA